MHLRPNGKWATDYKGVNGENLALGQSNALEAQIWLEEEYDLFSGQGHRRNMLSVNDDMSDLKFKSFAVGCYELDGVKVWAEVFSCVNAVDPVKPYKIEWVNENGKYYCKKDGKK